MAQSKWGGRRAGAGRKKGIPTKAVRIPMSLWKKIESGYFENIEALLTDWEFRSKDASPTSPRYEKLRELLEELKQISE